MGVQVVVLIEIKGKKVIVTGGTKGIGERMSLAFAEAAADVYVTGTNREQIEELN